MAFIHIATSQGFTIDDVRRVADKVGPRDSIDGLLVEAASSEGGTMRHVTVWESRAHKDRYEAERLLPAFQALGLAADVAASTEFVMGDTDDLFIR
jgi:hypothetical protein